MKFFIVFLIIEYPSCVDVLSARVESFHLVGEHGLRSRQNAQD